MTGEPDGATALLRALREELYTPVVGDVLDQLGYYHQFLPPEIRAIRSGMKVAGYAMTSLVLDVFGPQAKPFGMLTEALDSLQPDEVYLAGGGAGRSAYWGELLTATARTRGAAGAVLAGWHRDTPQVLEQDWPVFSFGAWAQDSSVRTQVVDYRCPIEIGGVTVNSGDVIFGDIDGVVVIPAEHAEETVARALVKARGERQVRAAIEGGMSSTAAFATFGIL
jgi:regulator of RNase E activity RraA